MNDNVAYKFWHVTWWLDTIEKNSQHMPHHHQYSMSLIVANVLFSDWILSKKIDIRCHIITHAMSPWVMTCYSMIGLLKNSIIDATSSMRVDISLDNWTLSKNFIVDAISSPMLRHLWVLTCHLVIGYF